MFFIMQNALGMFTFLGTICCMLSIGGGGSGGSGGGGGGPPGDTNEIGATTDMGVFGGDIS